jgi:hypothetical protein
MSGVYLKTGRDKDIYEHKTRERTFLHAYKFSFVNESVFPQGIF